MPLAVFSKNEKSRGLGPDSTENDSVIALRGYNALLVWSFATSLIILLMAFVGEPTSKRPAAALATHLQVLTIAIALLGSLQIAACLRFLPRACCPC